VGTQYVIILWYCTYFFCGVAYVTEATGGGGGGWANKHKDTIKKNKKNKKKNRKNAKTG
jgi:hypothetical protein